MTATALLNVAAWGIQAGILALAATALARLARVDAPAARYAWWRAVLVVCLALPILQTWQPPRETTVETLPTETGPAAVAPPAVATVGDAPGPAAAPAAAPLDWNAIASVVLVGGVLVRLTWLAAGLARLRRVRTYGTPASAGDGQDDLRQALVDAGADLRYVAALRQPVTFGVFRPVVLLPDAVASMPTGVQRAVLAHELWHVRRRDWLWSFCEELLCAALWFNPAVWYLVSRVQGAREEVVDELSIRSTNARRSYLEALLAFADEPAPFAAAPFIRRRQLFHRMMLISREGAMSPRRILVSIAAMAVVLVLTGWYSINAFPLTAHGSAPAAAADQQPRDPRPGTPRSATSREAELRAATTADPSIVKTWLDLAALQEARGALTDAEGTLRSALAATSAARPVGSALAQFLSRQGRFDETVAMLESLAAQNPGDPSGHQLVATYYEEKARKDRSLSAGDKLMYVEAGIRAADRALALQDDYVEALVYKNILLRLKAVMETDQSRRQELIGEADALRGRALALARTRPASNPQTAPDGYPPPPPPPPPPPAWYWLDGQRPVRVGDGVIAPAKLHHVDPVYPDAARAARVSAAVVVEAAIDKEGVVRGTRIVRSIPMLDDAAAEAVKQWRFAPTLVDGSAVPVVMNVSVRFRPQ